MSEDTRGRMGQRDGEEAFFQTNSEARRTGLLGLFSHGSVVRMLLFLTALGMIYISMRNYYISLWRSVDALEEEVMNLHYEAITTQSELMRLGSASEVVRLVEEHQLGLEPSKHPPVKIKLIKP